MSFLQLVEQDPGVVAGVVDQHTVSDSFHHHQRHHHHHSASSASGSLLASSAGNYPHHSPHVSGAVEHAGASVSSNEEYEGIYEPCQLVGGSFAIIIQLLLGVVVLSALFLKRYWDVCGCKFKNPERDFKVWALDVSKQAIGSCFAHGCNLVLAILLSGIALQNPGEHPMHPDECAWYFINFLADSFLGIPLSWALLEVVHMIAIRCNLEGLHESGNYGEDMYWTWLMQLIAWLWIVFATKLTLGLLIWPLGRSIGRFGVWMFKPLRDSPQIELVIVMVLAPSIINVFVFWIYDNMLMAGPDDEQGTEEIDEATSERTTLDPEQGKSPKETSSSHNRKSKSPPRHRRRDDIADGGAEEKRTQWVAHVPSSGSVNYSTPRGFIHEGAKKRLIRERKSS